MIVGKHKTIKKKKGTFVLYLRYHFNEVTRNTNKKGTHCSFS